MSCVLLVSVSVWMPTFMSTATHVDKTQETPLSYAVPDAVRAAGFGTAAVGSGASLVFAVKNMKNTLQVLKSKLVALAKLIEGPLVDVSKKEALEAEIKLLKKRLLIAALWSGGSLGSLLGSGLGAYGYAKNVYKINKAEKESDRTSWSNRQKQSRASQIFSKKPFMQRPHTSFGQDRLEDGLAAPGWTPDGTTSDYLEDITPELSDTFSVTPRSPRTQRVPVTLGSPEVAALAAGHRSQEAIADSVAVSLLLATRLSPGLTALGIEAAERVSIMQRVCREVVGISPSQAKMHIESVLQQLAEAKSVTNLDALIEVEVKKRQAAAVQHTL